MKIIKRNGTEVTFDLSSATISDYIVEKNIAVVPNVTGATDTVGQVIETIEIIESGIIVNSFRIVTLVKDGKAHIIANAMRINLDDAIAIGCSDAYMRLGEDGKITSRVVDDIANVYEEHPIAKIKFDTVKVPFVKEAYEMALEAALVVPEVRYVGWDIAITDNGPVIMEGNEYPSYGLVQYYLFNDEHEGHLAAIEKILGDEMKKIKL